VEKGSSASASSSTRAKSGANWGTEVAAIDKIITELIGPETGSASPSTAAPTGTSGKTTEIDETTKDKLRDVRRHVTALAGSMSGPGSSPAPEASSAAASPDTMGAAPSPSSASTQSQSPSPSTAQQAEAPPNPEPTATPQSTSPQSTTQPAEQPSPSSQQPTQVDAAAAKQHLSEARESLSQIAGMPEASRLQGEARNQVSQLISNFNELITTQADWKSAYAKVEATLNTLLAPQATEPSTPPASPTPSAEPNTPTGTTGTAGAPGSPAAAAGGGTQLDPAIRAKLEEFRTHMKEFEKAAGGATPSGSTGSVPPAVSTSSTTNPATPAPEPNPQAANPAGTSSSVPGATPAARPESPTSPEETGSRPSAGVAGATGTTGTMSANAQAQQHLDAIADILSKAKDGKLDKEQTEQIKSHVDQLRQILK
jgi:hypothetical protein